MYESYWQLREKPFESGCDPRFYYPGESHQAALLKLRYAVESGRGGAVLAGPSGSGKTLVLDKLVRTLGPKFTPVVRLVFPQMTAEEILAYLAKELSPETSRPDGGLRGRIRRIQRSLAENAHRGQHALVAIDEAHLLDDPRTLEALRLLLNFQHEGRPALTLLLVGQTGLLPILDRMPQFGERLSVKCLLRPFQEVETVAYVSHRLKQAGLAPIFEPEALGALHRLTHGLARRINTLADLALLVGFAEQRDAIAAEQLEAVSQELLAVVPD